MSSSRRGEGGNVAMRASAARSRPPERRRSPRGDGGEPARSHLVAMILGAYAEMPGLSLHEHQAARLFGLRDVTCRVILADLVEAGMLWRSADGQYRPAPESSERCVSDPR